MQYKQTDNYTNNRNTTIDILDSMKSLIRGLDHFMAYIRQNLPHKYDNYYSQFQLKLHSLISDPNRDLAKYSNSELDEFYDTLSPLQRLYLQFSLEQLEIPPEHSSQQFATTWYHDDKSFLFPAFYRLQTLCDIVGRQEGMELYKAYVDKRYYEMIEENLELKDLDYIWDDILKEDSDPHPSYGIGFRESKGKVGFRVDKCVNFDVLRILDDPELSHTLCCYGDTSLFEARNPNFVYTMPNTLMKGDPYCDKCFHDTRHIDRIEHPPEQLWKSLDKKIKISKGEKCLLCYIPGYYC